MPARPRRIVQRSAWLAAMLAISCVPPAKQAEDLRSEVREETPAPYTEHDAARGQAAGPGVRASATGGVGAAAETQSPTPAEPPEVYRALRCRMDGAFLEGAAWLATQAAARPQLPEIAAVRAQLRRAGSGATEPTAKVLSFASNADAAAVLRALARELTQADPESLCGVADASGPQGRKVALVLAPARGRLHPVPARGHVGQWLTVRAELSPDFEAPHLYVQQADGRTFTVPVSRAGAVVTGRVSAQARGRLLIQLVATLQGGPRPIFEAPVLVDVDEGPSESPAVDASAQLTPKTRTESELREQLREWMNEAHGARYEADPALDHVAQRHAEHMRETRRAAHDLGAGLPTARVAHLQRAEVAENVGYGPNLAHVHRGILASPSHAANLTNPRLRRVGVGVARGPDGTFWVAELLTSGPEPERQAPANAITFTRAR